MNEEKLDLPVRTLILLGEVRDLRDASNAIIGSVLYADTFLVSTIELNGG